MERSALWQQATIDWFTDPSTWQQTLWMGVPTLQCPLDLWILQELIVRTRPARIIETGTAFGGSALFMANICACAGLPVEIHSIDIDPGRLRPEHSSITYHTGSSVDPRIVAQFAPGVPTLVRLDSDHSTAHVAQELEAYAPLVLPGGYLIVEDTAMGHPCPHPEGPGATGPWEAVQVFLATHPEFVRDAGCERYKLTSHPDGYLLRV